MTRRMKVAAAVAGAVLVFAAGIALAAARPWDSSSSARPWMPGGMMSGSTMPGGMMSSTMPGGMMSGSTMPRWMRTGAHMGSMMGGAWAGGDSAPGAIEGARQLTVTAGDLRFSPSKLTLTAGEAVNVVIRNSDEMVHDFTVPALGVQVTVQPGEEATVGLRPASAGTHPFLCTVPGHAAAGMTGTIVVKS